MVNIPQEYHRGSGKVLLCHHHPTLGCLACTCLASQRHRLRPATKTLPHLAFHILPPQVRMRTHMRPYIVSHHIQLAIQIHKGVLRRESLPELLHIMDYRVPLCTLPSIGPEYLHIPGYHRQGILGKFLPQLPPWWARPQLHPQCPVLLPKWNTEIRCT